MSSKVSIFGGFGWVCSSILLDKPGFGRVQCSLFLELAHFWPNRFEVRFFGGVRKGSKFDFGG